MTAGDLRIRAERVEGDIVGLRVGDAMLVVEYAELSRAYLARGELDSAETALEIAEIEAARFAAEETSSMGAVQSAGRRPKR